MSVTRCVCYRTGFARIRELARRHGWQSVADIQRATGCGTGCGGCVPYLAAVLATGACSFAVRRGPAPPQPYPPESWDPPADRF